MDYLRHYERLFDPFRHEEIDIIEIGIDQGASLALWPKFFTKARIVGVDIHAICKKHEGGRVIVEIGSAADFHKLSELMEKYKPKIIIDDGSHIANEIMSSFFALFPVLLPGGLYVIEDLNCHYGADAKIFASNAPIIPSNYIFSIAHELLALRKHGQEGGMMAGDFNFDAIDSIEIIRGAIIIRKTETIDEAAMFERWIAAADQSYAEMTWRIFSHRIETSSLPLERKAELFLRCTERDPGNLYHFYGLSAVLGELGDLEGAIKAARRSLELSSIEENVNASRQRLEHFLAKERSTRSLKAEALDGSPKPQIGVPFVEEKATGRGAAKPTIGGRFMDTIGNIHSSQLDDYVKICDVKFGGEQNGDWLQFVSDFGLTVDTKVDLTLDPFSEEYFDQQLALHRELSGRELDQSNNELLPVDVAVNVAGQNPCASVDVKAMSRHASTITVALKLASLPDGARILDLGAGSGMSSELMAYCGAKVTAVDINPLSVELIQTRASKLGLPIKAHVSNFDAFDDAPGSYDAAFFFASLHHGLKPWEILERVSGLIKPGGKIVLAVEPIQNIRWPYWGLRLDPGAVYVTRKWGWFESGWSEAFLRKMFHRIGFAAELIKVYGGIIEGDTVVVAKKSDAPLSDLSLDIPVIQRGAKVSFGASAAGRLYLTEGWSAASDDWGTWSSGGTSGLLLSLPPGDSWDITVEAYPLVAANHLKQVVEITANGVFNSLISLDGALTATGPLTFGFRVEKSQMKPSDRGNLVEIGFRYPLATKPQLIGAGNDPRTLAIGIVSLVVQ